MLIHFKNIDGRNVAQAEVEIPDQILNHFPVSQGHEGSYIDIAHVRNGSFTGVMGSTPLRFLELPDKLTMRDKSYKEVHATTAEEILKTLGFEKKGPAIYSHPGLDNDCITFDPRTDDIAFIIRKVFDLGFDV